MKKITFYLLLTFLTLISQHTLASNVASVSKENFAQYGKEDAYWVVTVTCNSQDKYIVQRKTDNDTWCTKGNNNFCSDDKKMAFEKACSSEHIAEAQKAKEAKQNSSRALAAQQAKAAQEKALAEQRIREAEQRIQQKIFIEDSIASIQKEIQTLDRREQEIQQRLAQINQQIQDSADEEEE